VNRDATDRVGIKKNVHESMEFDKTGTSLDKRNLRRRVPFQNGKGGGVWPGENSSGKVMLKVLGLEQVLSHIGRLGRSSHLGGERKAE